MAQFARPDSDVSFALLGGTPVDTAGDRWQNIDESTPSDTDYVYSPNNPGGTNAGEFGLSNVSDPGVDTGHVLRIRTAQIDEDSGAHPQSANTGGTATTCAWELRQGATTIESGDINPADFATTEVNLASGNVASITDYTDLRVFVNPSGGGGSPTNRRAVAISWIELEIPDAAASTDADAELAAATGAAADATVDIQEATGTMAQAQPAQGIGHI